MHAFLTGSTDQIALFRAFNSDDSANTALTAATAGLTLSWWRVGLTEVAIASLTDKAADNTAHAGGAIRQVSGNLYSIDLPDAAVATQCPSGAVKGSYTGGFIEGVPHALVGYNATEAAVGVWDEAQASHTNAGTFGLFLDAAVSGVSTGGVSASDIADAVWDEATSGHVTAGTFGAISHLSTSDIDARLAAYDAPTKAELDSAQSSIESAISTVDGVVDSILTDTGTTLPATIGALNNLSTLDIDARLAVYDAPTKAELDSAQSSIEAAIAVVDGIADSILVDTESTLPAIIGALNNLSTSDIDARLTAYDAPTKAELDSAQSSIEAAIAVVDGIADSILVDTGTSIPDLLSSQSSEVSKIPRASVALTPGAYIARNIDGGQAISERITGDS